RRRKQPCGWDRSTLETLNNVLKGQNPHRIPQSGRTRFNPYSAHHPVCRFELNIRRRTPTGSRPAAGPTRSRPIRVWRRSGTRQARKQTIAVVRENIATPTDMLIGSDQRKAGAVSFAQPLIARRRGREISGFLVPSVVALRLRLNRLLDWALVARKPEPRMRSCCELAGLP